MKYLLLFLTGAMLLMQIACKSESDVLINYNDGTVTRGEFYTWLDVRRMPKESILKNRAQEKAKLNRMIIDVLSIREAKKANYQNTEDYKYAVELSGSRFISQYLMKNLKDKVEFKEEVIRPRIIKLYVKNYKITDKKRVNLTDEELKAELEKRKAQAAKLIKQINDGADFEELAKKYSDDYSKKKGGDLYYITSRDRQKAFTDKAFSMKKGEMTKEPLVIGNAVYIIKIEDKTVVTDKNIDDVIDKEASAKSMRRRLEQGAGQNLQKELFDAKDLVKNFDKVSDKNEKTVIFSIGNDKYTVADLNKLLAYITKWRGGVEQKFDDRFKKQVANSIFRERVLVREAKKRGLDKEEDFKKQYEFYKSFILAQVYMESEISKGIEVKPEEIRKEYNTNKDKMYVKRERGKKGKIKKTVLPFKEVEGRIHSRLISMQKMQKRRDWENNLKKKYNYKINEDKLEGEEVAPSKKVGKPKMKPKPRK